MGWLVCRPSAGSGDVFNADNCTLNIPNQEINCLLRN
jgi:hypothetical protein